MKKFTKFIAVLFILVQSGIAYSQSNVTIYADTVLAVSSAYNPTNINCSLGSSACQILGSPNAYPLCQDNAYAWAFNSPYGANEWIEIGYNTPIYVDTIRVYETYHSGAIDTLYLRDAQTGIWNIVYTDTVSAITTCNILDIAIPTTTYMVDAVKFSIGNYSVPSLAWIEYDAVALIGSTTLSSINKTVSDNFIISNLNDGSIFINSKNANDLIKSIYLNDVMGRQIGVYNVNNNSFNINTSNFKNGIYFINIILENGKMLNHKVFITK